MWRLITRMKEATAADPGLLAGTATRNPDHPHRIRPCPPGPGGEPAPIPFPPHTRRCRLPPGHLPRPAYLGQRRRLHPAHRPAHSDKGYHLVINAILDASGAVVTTSTRPDNLTATLTACQHHGPVAVFDPQHLADGLPAGLRWSPIRGCADPLTAMIHAAGLASASGLSSGGGGTLYLLATGACASLVAALVEDLIETARRLAAHSLGVRLDPPLLLSLDEIGNLAPLPSLPTLMAEGGGTGITTWPVLQSLAQARDKWNDNQASAIWDSAIVKIFLGGAANSRDLQDLSTLIGKCDEATDSTSIAETGTRSNQRSIRRVAILPPHVIRSLPFGTDITLLRAAPPIITRLRSWTTRPDAHSPATARRDFEKLFHHPQKKASGESAHWQSRSRH